MPFYLINDRYIKASVHFELLGKEYEGKTEPCDIKSDGRCIVQFSGEGEFGIRLRAFADDFEYALRDGDGNRMNTGNCVLKGCEVFMKVHHKKQRQLTFAVNDEKKTVGETKNIVVPYFELELIGVNGQWCTECNEPPNAQYQRKYTGVPVGRDYCDGPRTATDGRRDGARGFTFGPTPAGPAPPFAFGAHSGLRNKPVDESEYDDDGMDSSDKCILGGLAKDARYADRPTTITVKAEINRNLRTVRTFEMALQPAKGHYRMVIG